MKTHNKLTKLLAIVGTLLVWFPILAPIVLTLAFLFLSGLFRFDYLMPAELFLAVIIGGGLLIWAAFRAHAWLKWIAWSVGVAAGVLVAGQAIATLTGIASGATEPSSWWMVVIYASLIIYILGVLFTGVGGILLLNHLFRKVRPSQVPQTS